MNSILAAVANGSINLHCHALQDVKLGRRAHHPRQLLKRSCSPQEPAQAKVGKRQRHRQAKERHIIQNPHPTTITSQARPTYPSEPSLLSNGLQSRFKQQTETKPNQTEPRVTAGIHPSPNGHGSRTLAWRVRMPLSPTSNHRPATWETTARRAPRQVPARTLRAWTGPMRLLLPGWGGITGTRYSPTTSPSATHRGQVAANPYTTPDLLQSAHVVPGAPFPRERAAA